MPPRSWRDVVTVDPRMVPHTVGGLGRVRTTHRPAQRRIAAALAERDGDTAGMTPDVRLALERINAKDDDGGGFSVGDIFGAGRAAFGKALDIIDTPHAAVVAAISEFESDDDESWWEKTSRNITAGELQLVQNGLPTPAGTKASPLLAGIALDVALDPLTLLAPQSKLDDVQSVARKLGTEGVEALGEQGARQAAAKVLKARTASVLTDQELAAIGAKGGVYVNVPGKGPIGRTLQVDKLIDKVAGREVGRQVQIISRQNPIGRAGQAASRALHAPVAGTLNSKPFQKLTKVGLNGSKPLARLMMRSGDPDLAFQGLWGLTTDAEGRYMGHGWEQRAGHRAADLLSRARDAGVDTKQLTNALRGDVDALDAIALKDPDLVSDFQANTVAMREELNKVTDLDGSGMEWVADAGEFYQPRFLDDAKVPKDSKVRQGNRQVVSTIMGRKLEPGADFMGTTLVDPATAKKSIERQVDEILYDRGLIDQATLNKGSAWWKDDIAETLPLYIRMMGHQLSTEYTGARLRQLGIGDSLYARVSGSTESEARGMLHELTNRLSGQKAAQRQAARRAEEADAAAVSVTDDAIKFDEAAAKRGEESVEAAARATDRIGARSPDAAQLEEYSAAAFAAADDLGRGTQAWLSDARTAENSLSLDVAAQRAQAEVAARQLDEGVQRLDRLYEYRQTLADKLDGALERADFQMGGGAERIAAQLEETADEMSRADALLNELESAWGDATAELAHVDDMIGQVNTKLEALKGQLDDANSVLAYETMLRGSSQTDDFASASAQAWGAAHGGKARQFKRWAQTQINTGETYLMGLNTRRRLLQRAEARAKGEVVGGRHLLAEANQADEAAMQAMFEWGRDSLARQYQELGDAAGPELRDAIMRPALEAEEALGAVDREIANMGPSLADLQGNVTRNQRAVRDLEAKLAELTSDNQSKLAARYEAALELRLEAEQLYDAAVKAQQNYDQHNLQMFSQQMANAVTEAMTDQAEILKREALVANLEAQAKAAHAALAEADEAVEATTSQIKNLQDDDVVKVLQRGFRQYGAVTQLPEDLAEAMSAAARMNTPEGLRTVTGIWDRVQGLWKAYQVTSPGFHFRNTFGGINNNWLAGMDEVAYAKYLELANNTKGTAAAFRRRNPEWAEAFDAFEAGGFRTGGQTAYEVEDNVFNARINANPLSRNFAPLKANRTGTHVGGRMVLPGGEQVENTLRGSLFMDTYVKARKAGATAEGAKTEAMAKMLKYHFDYEDLSSVERSLVRRLVPFYTWTRKNLPLQLEMLAKQPSKINRYFVIKRNVEAMSEEEGIVPGYFEDSFAMRLPFTEKGGNMYAMPDLPFQSISEVTDAGMTAGMVTPLVKTPYELWAGKQVFKGLPLTEDMKPMPPSFALVPGLKEGLRTLGWADQGPDGQWYSNAKGNYLVEQALPVMARARRLLPFKLTDNVKDEEKYEERFWSSALSFNLGLGVRTNTRDEQENQLWAGYYDTKAELERSQQLGYLAPGRIGMAEVQEAAA